MVLIPFTYTQAVGLQSEINSITVTRVANKEAEYLRTINAYRRDMFSKINSIRRSEKRLKNTMLEYSEKMKQHRKAKEEQMQRWAELDERTDRLVKQIKLIPITRFQGLSPLKRTLTISQGRSHFTNVAGCRTSETLSKCIALGRNKGKPPRLPRCDLVFSPWQQREKLVRIPKSGTHCSPKSSSYLPSPLFKPPGQYSKSVMMDRYVKRKPALSLLRNVHSMRDKQLT